MRPSILLVIVLSLPIGCSKETAAPASDIATTTVAAQSELTPEQLGELGAQIKKNPDDAERLLRDRGLTEESFEQAIRRVSEDPAASQRYAAAYKNQS